MYIQIIASQNGIFQARYSRYIENASALNKLIVEFENVLPEEKGYKLIVKF